MIKKVIILKDEWLGEVTVDGHINGWPCTHYNRGHFDGLLPILQGQLVLDVCDLPNVDVATKWGVSRYIVNRWRWAVAGSDNVFSELAMKRQDTKWRKRYET